MRAMLSRWGGLRRFADDWFALLQVANVAGKHHIIQRSFEAMLRLMELADRSEGDRRKLYDTMSNKELEEFLVREIVNQIWKQPDIAVVVLEKMGWTLLPPDVPPSTAAIEPTCAEIRQRFPGVFGAECATL